MKLTSFSRGFWESAVECKASPKVILNHYDLLKDRQEGKKTIGQLAVKYGISRQQVCNIINKYK